MLPGHTGAGANTYRARAWEVVRLATPASISMLSYTLVGVVDTVLMGHLGSEAVAGVGLANTLFYTLTSLMTGTLGATSTLSAQHEGAGQKREAGAFLHQATWLAVLGGLLIGIPLSLMARNILTLMQPGAGVIEAAASYLSIRALGLPLFCLTVARDQFLEGLGDTKTPMRVAITINLLHVATNYWFIFGGLGIPAMGPAGAAVSTVLAHATSLLLYRRALRRRHEAQPEYGLFPMRGLDLKRLRQMLRLGLPLGVQYCLDVGSWLLLTMFIGWMGDKALAANQITLRIMSVTFMTIQGVSVTTTSLVGRHLGAGEPEEARRYGWTAIVIGVAIMLTLGISYQLFPGFWIHLFTKDPEVEAITRQLLHLVMYFQLLDTIAMVTFGALKGAGDTRFTMWLMAGTAWLVGLPLGYLLAFPMGYGAAGVYLALIAQLGVVAILIVHRFMGNHWSVSNLVAHLPVALEPKQETPQVAGASAS